MRKFVPGLIRSRDTCYGEQYVLEHRVPNEDGPFWVLLVIKIELVQKLRYAVATLSPDSLLVEEGGIRPYPRKWSRERVGHAPCIARH